MCGMSGDAAGLANEIVSICQPILCMSGGWGVLWVKEQGKGGIKGTDTGGQQGVRAGQGMRRQRKQMVNSLRKREERKVESTENCFKIIDL